MRLQIKRQQSKYCKISTTIHHLKLQAWERGAHYTREQDFLDYTPCPQKKKAKGFCYILKIVHKFP